MVEGPTLLREAVNAGWEVTECFATATAADDIEESLDCPVYVLDERLFSTVADVKSPQGVMAVVSMKPPFNDADHGIGGNDAWVLVADGVSDPGNLGTIMRSAEAAGASRVLLVNDTVDPFAPKVVRSSAGALFHVPVATTTYADLRASSLRILGLTSHDQIAGRRSVSMHDVAVSGPIAVVVGSEAHGIAADAPVDEWVTIPHAGRAESLNAAMAATVMCMHVSHARAKTVRRPAS